MLLKFLCPYCDTKLEADSSTIGHTVPCPHCDSQINIPEATLGTGVTLGDFFIERAIGEGGMGQVFLARQKSMDRVVALKVLPAAKSNKSVELYERFMQEIRIAARLDHPNIVTAYYAGEDDGHYYYAMAFVDGDDLDAYVERHGPLAVSDALLILPKVAASLSYAWDEQRLLHRDIKPSNIMLDHKREVKLLDLGISKSLNDDSSLTMAGSMIGTPGFVSPEQARGDTNLDCRSDIFSLGATLYFLLSGKPPFDGDNVMQILYKVTTTTAPSIRTIKNDIPEPVEQLVSQMMAVDRNHRPSDWPALIRHVDAALAACSTSAQASPPAAVLAAAGVATARDTDVTIFEPVAETLPEPSTAHQSTASAPNTILSATHGMPQTPSPEQPHSNVRWWFARGSVVILLIGFLMTIVVALGVRNQRARDKQRQMRLHEAVAVERRARELVEHGKATDAAVLVQRTINQFPNDVIQETQLPQVLKGIHLVTDVAEAASSAHELASRGEFETAKQSLMAAVDRLPDDVRPFAKPYYVGVSDDIRALEQQHRIRERMTDFVQALVNKDKATAVEFISQRFINQHGRRKGLIAVNSLVWMISRFRIDSDHFEITQIDLHDEQTRAEVQFRLYQQGVWKTQKTLHWTCDDDGEWRLMPSNATQRMRRNDQPRRRQQRPTD